MRSFLASLAMLFITNGAIATGSHCDSDSQVVFNCKVVRSTKVVSVCKIRSDREGEQYLQYHFGRVGSVELTFPKKPTPGTADFRYRRDYSRIAGYLRHELAFTQGRHEYEVYWEDARKVEGGVAVSTPGRNTVRLICGVGAIHELGSALTSSVTNVAEAEDK